MRKPSGVYNLAWNSRKRAGASDKSKREHYLRLLWIAYFEKHMKVFGHLPRRLGTQPINFDAFKDFYACAKCGKLKKGKREFCWDCRGRETIRYSTNESAQRKRRQQKSLEIAKRGKKERIEALENLSAGDLRDLFNPISDISENWPPRGHVHLPERSPVYLEGGLEGWFEHILVQQFRDIREIPPREFREIARVKDIDSKKIRGEKGDRLDVYGFFKRRNCGFITY